MIQTGPVHVARQMDAKENLHSMQVTTLAPAVLLLQSLLQVFPLVVPQAYLMLEPALFCSANIL